MASACGFNYAQVRTQSRYGQRADESTWLRLYNIFDLASYLNTAQQTALCPWVLGIDANHTSHEMELALRQKYRLHADEVTRWLPEEWRTSFYWVKHLPDVFFLQYLLAGGKPLPWMEADPALSRFVADDASMRQQAMVQAGYGCLVKSWLQGDSMLDAWFERWQSLWPESKPFQKGMKQLAMLMREQLLSEEMAVSQEPGGGGTGSSDDYDSITHDLGVIFRRYAFQPVAPCAYLAIVAADVHHLRSDLMQRLFFPGSAVLTGQAFSAEDQL